MLLGKIQLSVCTMCICSGGAAHKQIEMDASGITHIKTNIGGAATTEGYDVQVFHVSISNQAFAF